jgi:hypothetical protein
MAKPLLKKPSVEPGAVIDGFTVGACIHRGGMATLWSVTRADVTVPLLMKIPRISEGDDPAAIVGFEMEQMILPRLSGPHVPAGDRAALSGDRAGLAAPDRFATGVRTRPIRTRSN